MIPIIGEGALKKRALLRIWPRIEGHDASHRFRLWTIGRTRWTAGEKAIVQLKSPARPGLSFTSSGSAGAAKP